VAFFRFLLYKSLAMRFGILLVIFSFLFSCSDIEKDRQVKKINGLTNLVSKLKKELTQNKISDISEKNIAVYTVINRIKTYYYIDTIDIQFAKKMDAYKEIRKSLKYLGGNYEKIRTSLDEEKICLTRLKSDVINGFGQREKYADNIRFEKNKIQQIISLINNYNSDKAKFTLAFDSLHPILNDYSMRLEEKFKDK
jgi:hypothetical protein